MPKLVVNIGAMPRTLQPSQLEVACTAADGLSFAWCLGQEVLVATTLSDTGPPLLFATATLDRFVTRGRSRFALLTNLQLADSEIQLPDLPRTAVFSWLRDTMFTQAPLPRHAAFLELQEAPAAFVALDIYRDIGRQLRETRRGECSFSGVKVALGEGTATPIRPLDAGGEVHIRNFIFLHDEPAHLFNSFAWTIGPDFEIIIDASAAGTGLVSTINRTGKLLVGADQANWPDERALAWHRQRFLERLR